MIIMKPITATRVEIAAMAKKLDDLPILGVEITSAFAITGNAIVITKVLAASAIFWAEPKLERR
jgi:hypothetical protein